MKPKTALREVVGTKNVYVLRAYRFHLYSKVEKDERAITNLRRIDAVLLKILAAADMVIAFACAVAFIDGRTAGYALVVAILALTVVRFVLL